MKITFASSSRGNPFVLPEKVVLMLSAEYGRDVRVELDSLCESRFFEEKTFTKFMIVVRTYLQSNTADFG